MRHPPKRLTDLIIEGLPAAAEGERDEYPFAGHPGLALRVTDEGSRSWSQQYRLNGKQSRVTHGAFPAMRVKGALAAYRHVCEQLAAGTDPRGAKQAAREAAAAEALSTVAAAVNRWLDQEVSQRRPATQHEWRRIMEKDILPRWGKRPLASITKRDALALLDELVARGAPVQANRVLMRLRRFFAWCLERDLLTASPVATVEPPTAETARDRVLDDTEIAAFWRASDNLGFPFGPMFQLLLLCGQRLNEAGGMCWDELKLGDKAWTIGRQRYKSDREHDVALSDAAVELLKALSRLDGAKHVFTTTGKTPASGFSRATGNVRQDMAAAFGKEPAPWTLHDLRRTAATGMARLGFSPHVVDKVLGHTSGTIRGVAGIYNRFAYADECRDALEGWSRFVMLVLDPTPQRAVALRDHLALAKVTPSDKTITAMIEKLAPAKPGKKTVVALRRAAL
jgi:integrase